MEDIEQAFKTLEQYWQNPATGDIQSYQAALAFLATNSPVQAGLRWFFEDVTKPGGLTSSEAQVLMLQYLDLVERLSMPTELKRQFLLHLAGCEECAAEYLQLRDFEDTLAPLSEIQQAGVKLPRFKVPPLSTPTSSKATVQADEILLPVKVAWPKRWETTSRVLAQAGQAFKVLIAFRNQPTPQPESMGNSDIENTANEIPLFSNLVRRITITGWAVRSTPQTCAVIVSFNGIKLAKQPAGHKVTMSYQDHIESKVTNEQAQVTFENVPISQLLNLNIEIDIQLQV